MNLVWDESHQELDAIDGDLNNREEHKECDIGEFRNPKTDRFYISNSQIRSHSKKKIIKLMKWNILNQAG